MELIKLGLHNFDQYGFARFAYPGDYEETSESLVREVTLPYGSAGPYKVKMIFARSELVPLSTDPANKLIDQDYFKTLPMGQNVAAMYLLAQRAGWNQTPEDLKILTSKALTSLLAVAEIQGVENPLGSGLVLNLGSRLHWIGMILVHPELRRQGVATAIMQQCIEETRADDPMSIIGLDATYEGLQVYKRLGFQSSFKIWRSRLVTHAEIAVENDLEICSVESIEALSADLRDFDLLIKKEQLRLIHTLYPEGSWIAKSGGKTMGLIMTRPGRLIPLAGPIIAESSTSARSLLKHVLRYWQQKGVEEVFIDTPENHFSTASVWEDDRNCLKIPKSNVLTPEIKPERAFIRMYQVVTDEIFDQFCKDNSRNKHAGSAEVMELGREARQATLDYMNWEIASIKHLYASGGPEMS